MHGRTRFRHEGDCPTTRLPDVALGVGGVLLGLAVGAVAASSIAAPPAAVPVLVAVLAAAALVAIYANRAPATAPRQPDLPPWRDGELVNAARDLLLGRITSGMLHDLAQPLNVISMANSNLGHIVERLDIDAEAKVQLLERTARIADHTDGAADILALFRGLGRGAGQDGRSPRDDDPALTMGDALRRAIVATRSSLRHQLEVELTGDALDLRLPGRQGALEVLGIAALLSAFGAFVDSERRPLKGKVALRAERAGDQVAIKVDCADAAGQPLTCKPLDKAAAWLVGEVAREAGGQFAEGDPPSRVRLALRLGPV